MNGIQQQLRGALVSALVALPLGLAFGVASGLGAEAGIFGALIAGSLSALFGGTVGQHSGPTGAVAVLLALSVAHFSIFFPSQPELALVLTLFVVTLSGIIQIFFGWMKWGRLVELLPHSVVSGLLTSIGLMLVLEQLPAVLGGDNLVRPLEVMMALPEMITHPVWRELVLGLSSGMLMFAWARFFPNANRWLPAPLFVLSLGVFYVWVFSKAPMLQDQGIWWWADVRVIGPLSFSMPTLHFPNLEIWQLPYLVQSAFTLAVVGSLISLLGSVVTEKMTRQMHDPDQELIGQGVGNMISGLLGGMASTGAPMRTMVAMSYGSRQTWSAVVHAVFVGILALVASDLFAAVPLSVLGGMLIKVGLDQVDWSYLKRWKHIPKAGRGMMFAVLVTALALDLVTAVVVGLALASFVLVGRMTQLQLNAMHIGCHPATLPTIWFSLEEQSILTQANGKIVFVYLDVPMSFGAARSMSRRILTMQGQAFVFDFRAVPYIDFSSAIVLEDVIYRLQQRGALVWLLLALGDTQSQLQRQGVLSAVEGRVMFDRQKAFADALYWIKQ